MVVVGGQVPEVHVDILPDRLQAYGLTVSEVTSAVQSQFVDTAGGQFTTSDATVQAPVRVRTSGADLTTLGAVPVVAAGETGTPAVTLGNVANIYLGGADADEVLRVNGRPAIGLLVYKQSTTSA